MNKKTPKVIFISGGVISSVGKGITTATLSALLEENGYKVAPIKCDPYLNVDAGTIRPQEHGEVFVTSDGIETDQDLGNYERFIDRSLSRDNYVTNGQIYQTIIQKERNFEFEGEDVEIVPHVPEEIIERIDSAAAKQNADFVIFEIGGTVGEYQNILFIEANRIMKYRDKRDVVHIHVAYLPTPPSVGEMKTKPAQTSVRLLNSSGLQPDFVIGRSEKEMDDSRKKKLAWICNLNPDHVISAPDVNSIYEVPLVFEKQNFTKKILECFNLKPKKKTSGKFKDLFSKIKKSETASSVNIAVVGKYFDTGGYILADVYVSVVESLKHAAWNQGVKLNLNWVTSQQIEAKGADQVLSDFDGIVVPGGFGSRGTEGMLEAVRFAREKQIPYLGLCYGMQMAAIEFARNVLGIKSATTTEIDPDAKEPIIHIMPEQEKKLLKREYGGSMRLGDWDCKLKKDTLAYKLYKKDLISERHRHRFEFNNKYKDKLEKAGMTVSGTSPDGNLVEIIEIKDHPYFIASQFHPEFKSTPFSPAPLFVGLIKASKKRGINGQ